MNDDVDIIHLNGVKEDRPDAAAWLAKLDRGGMSAQERRAFAAWLRADPRNKDAIREAAAFWYGLSGALRQTGSAPERAMRVRARRRLFLRTGLAAACVFAVAAFTGALLLNEGVETSRYATDIGETRIVALADGSKIHLNTATVIEEAFAARERAVTLIAGEAIFDVAHDEKRPFKVYAAGGVIRAVGTRFAVRLSSASDREKAVVTVTEGRVALEAGLGLGRTAAVEAPSGAPSVPVLLREGEAADIDKTEGGTKRVVTDREVAERLSWADGQLIFYDRALEAVIDEVTRYTTVEIAVIDERLKAERLTGILPIGDVDEMLEGIEGALGVQVDWITENRVHITEG